MTASILRRETGFGAPKELAGSSCNSQAGTTHAPSSMDRRYVFLAATFRIAKHTLVRALRILAFSTAKGVTPVKTIV